MHDMWKDDIVYVSHLLVWKVITVLHIMNKQYLQTVRKR